VREYVERLYLPAGLAEETISDSGFQPARDLALWKARVRAAWPNVHVTHVETGGVDAVPQVGDVLNVRADVELGGLSPDDVSVEVVYGRARDGDTLLDPSHAALAAVGDAFEGTVPLGRAGSFGYNVRVVPRHPLLASSAEMGLIAVMA
jgi:starch phosphorylase